MAGFPMLTVLGSVCNCNGMLRGAEFRCAAGMRRSFFSMRLQRPSFKQFRQDRVREATR